MRERETGLNLTIKEVLEVEKRKDVVWEAADEMRSFVEDLAETREEVVQELLFEADLIREYLKKYDAAVEKLDGSEGGHQEPERHSVAHIPPDEGKSLWFGGELYTAKAGSEDTSGTFTLIEAVTPPGGGPLPHIHHREDKTFYVLEGELEFMVEGSPIKVGAGSCLYVRKGTLHTYSNVGTQPARYLGVLAPAGIERFFEEVSVPAMDRTSPPPFEPEDLDRILASAPKFGLEIRLPSET